MKVLFKVFSGLLVLILIVIVAFALTFNPNEYKKEIVALFNENTGRQISIPGDISLSLIPWIGLELGKINISNAKGFAKKPFAEMTHLQVRAKLWPLFQQRLEADTLVIEGLSLNLAINKHGISNWQDFLQNKKVNTSAAKTTKKESAPDETNHLLAAFAINGIKINRSQFTFHDQQHNQKTSINNIYLELGQLKPNSAIPFSSKFEVQKADLLANININNTISFSPDFKQFSFKDLKLNSKIKLAAIKKEQEIELTSKLISLNLNSQMVKSENLMLSANNAKLIGNVEAKNISENPHVTAQLHIETLNPQNIIKDFNIALPKMADDKALTKFNAKFNLSASTTKIDLSNIDITLDDSLLKGNAAIIPNSTSTVNLNINKINFDRYLPKPSTIDNKDNTKPTQPAALEAALIPVALLTQVQLETDIIINSFQIKKTHWENLQLVAKANKGIVNLNPIKLQGYGSTINSNINIKATEKNASLSLKLNIKDIKSGELLKDFMEVKKLQGLTSINANITSKGIKLSQLKQNLNGTGDFKLKEGIIKGFDLEYEIDKLQAKVKGKAAPVTPSPLQTKFTNLSASVVIKNGIVHNKDLRAATPFTRVTGKGDVNLANEKLNYVATVKLTNSRDIKSHTSFEKMNSIPLDVHIRGTFDKPEIKADFNKALKMIANKKLKKQKQKLKQKVDTKKQKNKEKAKKELKKKLSDKLKNLFKF